MGYSALMTDLYELTMLAGYLEEGMTDTPAVFDLFFRKNPFQGGYAVFAGLDPALTYLEGLRFSESDLAYLSAPRRPGGYACSRSTTSIGQPTYFTARG